MKIRIKNLVEAIYFLQNVYHNWEGRQNEKGRVAIPEIISKHYNMRKLLFGTGT